MKKTLIVSALIFSLISVMIPVYASNDVALNIVQKASETKYLENDQGYISKTIVDSDSEKGEVTVEEVNAAMKEASNESFGYTEEYLVSSDIIGITYGSLFDATQTMVTEVEKGLYQVQVVAWYDNENSYTSQMVRTIKYFAEIG